MKILLFKEHFIKPYSESLLMNNKFLLLFLSFNLSKVSSLLWMIGKFFPHSLTMSEKINAGKERRYLEEEWLLFCIHGKNDVLIKDLGVTLFAQKTFGKELCQMVNYNLLQDTNQVLLLDSATPFLQG
jgi:hypothetical protein